jgi:hypothetical protein
MLYTLEQIAEHPRSVVGGSVAGWNKGGLVALGNKTRILESIYEGNNIQGPACETKNLYAAPKPLIYSICDYI